MTSSDDLIQQAKSATGSMPAKPARGLAIVSCMDARVDPLRIFGLGVGDAHVIRNAGGLVNGEVLRSLLVSQYMLGTTAIDIVMHTDCGMKGLADSTITHAVMMATSQRVDLDFGGFDDLEQELHRGVTALRNSDSLRHRNRIRGLVFDVATGQLDVVVPA